MYCFVFCLEGFNKLLKGKPNTVVSMGGLPVVTFMTWPNAYVVVNENATPVATAHEKRTNITDNFVTVV
jgi:hypothetical protein